jgi:hypothetical protein
VREIVEKCTNSRRELRYDNVRDIIAEVEALDFNETDTGTPA